MHHSKKHVNLQLGQICRFSNDAGQFQVTRSHISVASITQDSYACSKNLVQLNEECVSWRQCSYWSILTLPVYKFHGTQIKGNWKLHTNLSENSGRIAKKLGARSVRWVTWTLTITDVMNLPSAILLSGWILEGTIEVQNTCLHPNIQV